MFNVASRRRRRLPDGILPAAVAAPGLRHRFTGRLAELSLNYGAGPLTEPVPRARRGSLVPGDRLPDVPLLTPEGHPVGALDLLSTRHTLLVLTGETFDSSIVEALTARFERFEDLVRLALLTPQGLGDRPNTFTDPSLRAHDRYRARAGKLLLVRPDGYLAAGARLQRPETIERYLLKLTGRTAHDDPTSNGKVGALRLELALSRRNDPRVTPRRALAPPLSAAVLVTATQHVGPAS